MVAKMPAISTTVCLTSRLDDALPEDTPEDEEMDDDLDIFGVEDAVAEPFELTMRTWTDNTGEFQTEARLVEILTDSVRLFKANGRYSNVPMHRLSSADLDYVQMVARATQNGQVKLARAN